MLNQVALADGAYFKRLLAPERVLIGDEIGADYEHDEMEGVHHAPDVLLRVTSVEEISQVLAYCNDRKLPVIARGSGTGLVGGAVAIDGGILLDTTLMNHILELDEENMTVTVEPGVLLMDLAKYTEEKGFLYPPDPGEKSATIGGNISTNAGGMRAVKYGVTRDCVLSLTVVLADGTVEVFGSKAVKNSSGYSLKDLMIGSEGTLGVVAGAVLRLRPLPQVSISLLCAFPSLKTAISAVPALLRSGTEPTAIEFLTPEAIRLSEEYLGKHFPCFEGDGALLLTFDGDTEEGTARRLEHAAELCLEASATDCYFVDTEERKKSVWQARGAFLEAIKASTTQMDECDVVVPRSQVVRFSEILITLPEKIGLRIAYFGHAGDGNLHIYFCRDNVSEILWHERLERGFAALYAAAAELGGQVSGEHGIGYAKRSFLRAQLGERQMALMRGIKAAFDPNGILNPQKVCMF
ncbi:MAG: FAD-binding oxidoreductase [Clostridiaceae bacterium]|nr:FAD-binding oxidoreductase [Clostridiaceae bacterium]